MFYLTDVSTARGINMRNIKRDLLLPIVPALKKYLLIGFYLWTQLQMKLVKTIRLIMHTVLIKIESSVSISSKVSITLHWASHWLRTQLSCSICVREARIPQLFRTSSVPICQTRRTLQESTLIFTRLALPSKKIGKRRRRLRAPLET